MPIFVTGPSAAVVELYAGMGFGSPFPTSLQHDLESLGANGQNLVAWADAFFNQFAQAHTSNADWAHQMLAQMLGDDPSNTPALRAQLAQLFDSQPADRGAIICLLGDALSRLEGDPVYGAAAAAWNIRLGESYNQAMDAEQFIVKYGPGLTLPQGVYTHALTAGADVVPGTPYDETFLARPGTLGSGDVLTGGGGDDWLLVRDYPQPSPGPLTGFTTTGIATLVVNVRNNIDNPSVVLDAAGMAGLAHVVDSGSWGNVEVLNLASVVDLKLYQVVQGNVTLHYTPAALAATGGHMALTLFAADGAIGPFPYEVPMGTVQVDGISRFDVQVQAGSDLSEIKSSALAQLVLSGGGDLRLHALNFQGNAAAAPNTLDAHAMTGRLDVMLGTSGPAGGSTQVQGGQGVDTLRFTGQLADYTLLLGDTVHLHDNRVGSARDYSVLGVERLVFADHQALVLDVDAGQDDGIAAMLLAAACGSAALKDAVLVGQVLAEAEQVGGYSGYSGGLHNLANLAQLGNRLLGSEAFHTATGQPLDNAGLVRQVYTNIYGHAPDAATQAALQAPLDHDGISQGGWLAMAVLAGPAPLQALLAGYAHGGLAYVEPVNPFAF